MPPPPARSAPRGITLPTAPVQASVDDRIAEALREWAHETHTALPEHPVVHGEALPPARAMTPGQMQRLFGGNDDDDTPPESPKTEQKDTAQKDAEQKEALQLAGAVCLLTLCAIAARELEVVEDRGALQTALLLAHSMTMMLAAALPQPYAAMLWALVLAHTVGFRLMVA